MQNQALCGSTRHALGDVDAKDYNTAKEKILFVTKDRGYKPNQKDKATVKYNY